MDDLINSDGVTVISKIITQPVNTLWFIEDMCTIYIDKNLKFYENSTGIFVLCYRPRPVLLQYGFCKDTFSKGPIEYHKKMQNMQSLVHKIISHIFVFNYIKYLSL